jgi:peptidoglycan/xylan/chitin deacetylase (PgdA/CDA1 family)
MVVRPERLREQLGALKQAGFRCLDLDELSRALSQTKPLDAPAFALTFDDGYRSVHDHGLPILEDLGMSATVFLTVGFLDGETAPPWGSRHPALVAEHDSQAAAFEPLGWDQAKALAARPFVRIGSHSLSHPLLGGLERGAAQREIEGSRKILEDRLGVSVTAFAYPFGVRRYGAYSELTEALVREAGFEASFTSEIGRARVGSGAYLVPRIPLTDDDLGVDARAKAAGAYDWVCVAQSAFQRIFSNPFRPQT